MNTTRDTQRSKLYKAEMVLWEKSRERWDMQQVQAYVNKVTASAWWGKNHAQPYLPIRVGDGRARRMACAIGRDEIRLPKWSRQEEVVLHELCHCVINSLYFPNGGVASHGREYAKMLLSIVRHFMGKTAYETLKASFKTRGVKYATSKI